MRRYPQRRTPRQRPLGFGQKQELEFSVEVTVRVDQPDARPGRLLLAGSLRTIAVLQQIVRALVRVLGRLSSNS